MVFQCPEISPFMNLYMLLKMWHVKYLGPFHYSLNTGLKWIKNYITSEPAKSSICEDRKSSIKMIHNINSKYNCGLPSIDDFQYSSQVLCKYNSSKIQTEKPDDWYIFFKILTWEALFFFREFKNSSLLYYINQI